MSAGANLSYHHEREEKLNGAGGSEDVGGSARRDEAGSKILLDVELAGMLSGGSEGTICGDGGESGSKGKGRGGGSDEFFSGSGRDLWGANFKKEEQRSIRGVREIGKGAEKRALREVI